MRVAELAGATVLLVADIDRGGAFAHLWGTWSLLPPSQRALIKGFVLNKFRGDPSLLDPAPAELERMTGVPVVGVIPYLRHGLPDEDGAGPATQLPAEQAPSVALIRYPTASNLDEFKPLEPVARVRWASSSADLEGADLVVLPGSKSVATDLRWLRERGLDEAIRARTRRGGRVLAICGGLQMLGERLEDDAGVDGSAEGLSLLPLITRFGSTKITTPTEARFRRLPEPWHSLSGLSFGGYEIRHGRSEPTDALEEAIGSGLGFVRGPVLASYVHGMFEAPEVVRALFGVERLPPLDETLDQLADAVQAGLDLDLLADFT
jgi:adenosylcobyric acid synthase